MCVEHFVGRTAVAVIVAVVALYPDVLLSLLFQFELLLIVDHALLALDVLVNVLRLGQDDVVRKDHRATFVVLVDLRQ